MHTKMIWLIFIWVVFHSSLWLNSSLFQLLLLYYYFFDLFATMDSAALRLMLRLLISHCTRRFRFLAALVSGDSKARAFCLRCCSFFPDQLLFLLLTCCEHFENIDHQWERARGVSRLAHTCKRRTLSPVETPPLPTATKPPPFATETRDAVVEKSLRSSLLPTLR
jgi:hypothetical protein